MTAPNRTRAAASAGSDRARRTTITCSCCGRRGAHRGHGLCVACYARWVYWGRPPEGPPLPWATPARLRQRRPSAPPERCRSGRHLLTDGNLIIRGGSWAYRACRREAEARYRKSRLARRHHGHDVITTCDGRLYCRTCVRGDKDVDEVAVERAVSGDPPPRLSIAEREQAIIRLRAWGLTYELISQRVGCSQRTAYATCKRLSVTLPAQARRWVEDTGSNAVAVQDWTAA